MLAVGEEKSKMLAARLNSSADFAGASQRVFCLDLFGCRALGTAPAKPFSRPYPPCCGHDWGRSARGFLIGIRIFGTSIWLCCHSTGKSLAASRVFRWSIVFPNGLRHARRELYVDRYHGFPMPLQADSRMVAKSNCDDLVMKSHWWKSNSGLGERGGECK